MTWKICVLVAVAAIAPESRADRCLYFADLNGKTVDKRIVDIEISIKNGVLVSAAMLPTDWQISIENSAGPDANFSAQAIHGAAALNPSAFDGVFAVKPILPDVDLTADVSMVLLSDGDSGKTTRGKMVARDGRCRSRPR